MTRKARSDSTAEMLRVAQGTTQEIGPPAHVKMTDRSWPFWHSVVAEFARADWTEHQLELAAMLSRIMGQIEEDQRLLEEEGTIIERDKFDKHGNLVGTIRTENPRGRAIQTSMGQALSIRRSLALHARAKSGSNADAAKQRVAGKKIEEKVSGKDRLLA